MLSVEQLSKQIADICPEDHLKSFLQRDVRPDGRSLDELRPLVLAKNVAPTADSSAMIRLGNTKVICGITAETIKPAAATPTDGSFSVNFEFSPGRIKNFEARFNKLLLKFARRVRKQDHRTK